MACSSKNTKLNGQDSDKENSFNQEIKKTIRHNRHDKHVNK